MLLDRRYKNILSLYLFHYFKFTIHKLIVVFKALNRREATFLKVGARYIRNLDEKIRILTEKLFCKWNWYNWAVFFFLQKIYTFIKKNLKRKSTNNIKYLIIKTRDDVFQVFICHNQLNVYFLNKETYPSQTLNEYTLNVNINYYISQHCLTIDIKETLLQCCKISQLW